MRLIDADALKRDIKHRCVLSPLDASCPLVYGDTDLPEIIDATPTANRDDRIQELLQENERLRRELARAKRIQFMLFRKVPAEEIMALIYETSEELK